MKRNLTLTEADVRVLCLALRTCAGEEQLKALIPHHRRLKELKRRVEGLCELGTYGTAHDHLAHIPEAT